MDLTAAAREPKRKIGRAVRLFGEAQAELNSWANQNPLTGRLVAQEDRRRIDILLNVREKAPLENVALVIGDAVHNLRSALDNLVWTLANFSGPPQNPKAIQFPVSEKGAGWRQARKDLATVPAEALDRIERFQPFTFDAKEECFLWHLHKLDIADKHRGYLLAEPIWKESSLEGLVLGLDAGTQVRPFHTVPRLRTWGGELLGWLEFSIPFWDRGPLEGSVSVQTSFSVSAERDGTIIPFQTMCQDFPRAVADIVDAVCGVAPATDVLSG